MVQSVHDYLRQRIQEHKESRDPEPLAVTAGEVSGVLRNCGVPVSYTHLDVYKRQAVVSAHSDIVPGHMNLDKLTDAVKSGIEAAGGTPFMVPAIGVCDGIAMGHVGCLLYTSCLYRPHCNTGRVFASTTFVRARTCSADFSSFKRLL